MKEEEHKTNINNISQLSSISKNSSNSNSKSNDLDILINEEKIPNINQFSKIKNCSILTYGIKPSIHLIPYGFCSTCDVNLIHPICQECLMICHQDHQIKTIEKPDYIICGCGERLHKFKIKMKVTKVITNTNCPYTDYNKLAGLSNIYVIGNYNVCEFCYNLCGHYGKGKLLEKDFDVDYSSFICECEKINNGITHTDLKYIYGKLGDFINNSKNNVFFNNLDPLKFFNLLFLAKNSYNALFSNFNETINEMSSLNENNKMKIKDNFLVTNFFLSLNDFCLLASKIKNVPLRYFSVTIVERLNFLFVNQIYSYIHFQEIPTIIKFLNKILFIYKKISLGFDTCLMDKYKIYDLENFSPLQRKCLYDSNIRIFPEAKEQMTFFINQVSDFINLDLSLMEDFDLLIQCFGILKKYSEYYLVNVNQMIEICFILEKSFEFFKRIKNNIKQLKIFYIVSKMFLYFIFHYNDEIIYKYIEGNISNIAFIFNKNELGRLISRSTIRILYYTLIMQREKIFKEEEQKISKKIYFNGIKILEYLIGEKDCYMANKEKFLKNALNYLNIIKINFEDNEFQYIFDFNSYIENYYTQFYSFKIYNNELIKNVNDILDKIISLAKSKDIKNLLLKSKIFFTFSKIFHIVKFDTNLEDHKNFLSNLILFYHYFIENNSEYCFLIFSHYIVDSLIKIPFSMSLDLFKLFYVCAEIIEKNEKAICFPKKTLKCLFTYINDNKIRSNKIKKEFKLNSDNDNNEIDKIIDTLVLRFFSIIIKLGIEIYQLNAIVTKNFVKKIIEKFFETFSIFEISEDNLYLILFIINKIYDPTDENQRKKVFELINIEILNNDLANTNIDIDYRTEILRFFKKFKYSFNFKQQNSNFNNPLNFFNIQSSSNNIFDDKKRRRMTKRKSTIHSNSGIVLQSEIDIRNLFSFGFFFEQSKNNDYLNAFGQNIDNYLHIKNNILISNYQFPTSYFTFFYYVLKMNEEEEDFYLKLNQEALKSIWKNELEKIKEIYEKVGGYYPKFLRYCVKGIIIPICCILKHLFCYTHKCKGNDIYVIYETIIQLMYLKNYLFDLHELYIRENNTISFFDFNVDGFFNKDNFENNYNDYFDLIERNNFSPFDYSHLFSILEKEYLQFVKYPKSLELETKFGEQCNLELVVNGENEEENYIKEVFSYRVVNKKLLNVKKTRKFTNNYNLINGTFKKVNKEEKKDEDKSDNNHNNNDDHNNNENKTIVASISNGLNQIKKILVPQIEIKNPKENLERKINELFNNYLKTKLLIEDNKNAFLVSLYEVCSELEVNFRKIFLCIIVTLSFQNENYNESLFLMLYKLLTYQTSETQTDIIENLGGKNTIDLGFLLPLSRKLYKKLIKIFINDFNIDYEHHQEFTFFSYNYVKIFKLLCEEHNNFFQEKILLNIDYHYSKWEINNNNNNNNSNSASNILNNSISFESDDSMSFFNFLINILHKSLIITKRAKNKQRIEYLYDIIYCIIELLVEIIQGNKKEIISENSSKKITEENNNQNIIYIKTFIKYVSEILFDDSMVDSYCFKIRLLLMSFLISILEEKTNDKIQKIIMKFLTINKILKTIISTLKNYFLEHTKNDPDFEKYYQNYTEKQILQREFHFDFTLYSYYKKIYFETDFSKTSDEFQLANNYYRYIKLLSINEKSPEAEDLIKQIESIGEYESKKKFALFNNKNINQNEISPINLINENERILNLEFVEHYYCIKFFEIITKVVEVRLPTERRNQKVIFTVPSEMIFLSEMTKNEFINNVDRTSETTKKSELIKSISIFQLEIDIYKNSKFNSLSKFIMRLDYIYIQWILYMYAFLFNIFMLVTLQGYKEIKSNNEPETTRRNLMQIDQIYNDAIKTSLDKWGNIYNYIVYVFCVLNGLFVLMWLWVKLPIYYKLDRLKYCEVNKIQEKSLTFFNKTYICLVESIFHRDYINTLLLMFIISIIGSGMTRGEIVYAFFLLTIINLNTTLKGVGLSIYYKLGELGATLILLIFLVFFYTNIGFFFLNKDYEGEIEEAGVVDNFCQSFIFCFLTNIDAGIRARGGAADQMIRISYERNSRHYIERIIFDVSYFLICIIIMIDLIFGIVLRTFSQMREMVTNHEFDKVNHCFICHETRAFVEKNQEDFQHHREVTHNVWNYVDYMIYLKFSDLHDLNAVNSWARENLDEKKISFLPSCKDNIKEEEIEDVGVVQEEESDEEESEETEEENEIIEEENNEDKKEEGEEDEGKEENKDNPEEKKELKGLLLEDNNNDNDINKNNDNKEEINLNNINNEGNNNNNSILNLNNNNPPDNNNQ